MHLLNLTNKSFLAVGIWHRHDGFGGKPNITLSDSAAIHDKFSVEMGFHFAHESFGKNSFWKTRFSCIIFPNGSE